MRLESLLLAATVLPAVGVSAAAQDSNPVRLALATGVAFGSGSNADIGTSFMISTVFRTKSSRAELRFDGIRNRIASSGEPVRRVQGGSLGVAFDLRKGLTPYVGAGAGTFFVGAPDVSRSLKFGYELSLGYRLPMKNSALFIEARDYRVPGAGSSGHVVPIMIGWRH